MYMATINTPGYLPEDDDPPVFDTASAAWAWLASERVRIEEDHEPGDYFDETDPDQYELSEVVDALQEMAVTTTDSEALGVPDCVVGHTMGRRGDSMDLGVAYCVTPVEHDGP